MDGSGPDPTAALASMALHALLAVALVVYSRFQQHYPGFLAWAAGMGSVAVAFLVMSLWSLGAAFSVSVATSLFLLGILLEVDGTFRFVEGRRLAPGWYLVPVAAAGLQFLAGTQDVAARQWIFALPAAVSLGAVWRTLEGNAPSDDRGLYRILAGLRFVVGVMIVFRAGMSSFSGDPSAGEGMGVAFFLGICATSTLESAGYLWMSGRRAEGELRELERSLQETLESLTASEAELEVLSGLLHLCPKCHRIADGEGSWHRVEDYVQDRSEARFSHGICPTCVQILYPDLA